jgi:HSP20 family protein
MNSQDISPSDAPERVFRRTPEVEIYEDEQALFVSADVPGVAPGNVDVSLEGGVLTLHARAEHGEHNGGTRTVTEFARRFTLREPERYDAEQVSATLRHGVLELRLPKAARARRRQIPVTVN